jgi:hypothetical protein
MKLTIKNTDGTERTVPLRDADTLTLSDWKLLTPTEPDTDATFTALSVFTGIPIEELNGYPLGAVRHILDIVGEELTKAYTRAERFRADLKEDESSWVPPAVIDIDGIPYRVPRDLEMETVYGQWVDWSRWEAPQHEADIIAEALAFLLVQEGKEYTGTTEGKIAEMMKAPMGLAMDLCAFFFDSSDEFRHVTSQRSSLFREYWRRRMARALKTSPDVIEDLIASLPPGRPTD